jgi:hypothetical protein
MTNDMKTNISGAMALALIVIQHYLGWSIPEWIKNDILIPVSIAAAGHVAWLVGKPETKKDNIAVDHEPSKMVTP